MDITRISDWPLDQLQREYQFCRDFFDSSGIDLPASSTQSLRAFIASLDDDQCADIGTSREQLLENFQAFFEGMLAFEQDVAADRSLRQLTIIGGRDKRGQDEDIRIDLHTGDIISIVGPTGSGKSRLLGDIEWMAQADTPTGRTILINGAAPDPLWRFDPQHKLVAQLSQNMNFVMDLGVAEFLHMHAESRMVPDRERIVQRIIEEANQLAGEPFDAETPITSLSGGQSRALMIADTAFLSRSPIVLIDEIENAGIDRQQALELLVREEKIVLIATHDPILALMAPRRIIIGGGGIRAVLETSDAEKHNLGALAELDRQVQCLRGMLRSGERLEGPLSQLG